MLPFQGRLPQVSAPPPSTPTTLSKILRQLFWRKGYFKEVKYTSVVNCGQVTGTARQRGYLFSMPCFRRERLTFF